MDKTYSILNDEHKSEISRIRMQEQILGTFHSTLFTLTMQKYTIVRQSLAQWICKCHESNQYGFKPTTTTVLRPIVRDYPGELVP